MKEFDESEAVGFINNGLKGSGIVPYPSDEILNIIDMIWDYYELNGLLDIDADEDVVETELVEEVTDYVSRMVHKDRGCKVLPEHIRWIVEYEMDYESSLE